MNGYAQTRRALPPGHPSALAMKSKCVCFRCSMSRIAMTPAKTAASPNIVGCFSTSQRHYKCISHGERRKDPFQRAGVRVKICHCGSSRGQALRLSMDQTQYNRAETAPKPGIENTPIHNLGRFLSFDHKGGCVQLSQQDCARRVMQSGNGHSCKQLRQQRQQELTTPRARRAPTACFVSSPLENVLISRK